MARASMIGLAVATVLVGLAASARADGPATTRATVDNRQYGLWSKFKPGSGETMTADVDVGAVKMHVSLVQTLAAVTADAASVTAVTTTTVLGQTRPTPPVTQTIPAKVAHDDAVDAGTADVQAMGRAFPCHVFHVKNGAAGAGGGAGTAYANDGVPGGLVKVEAPGPGGKMITFVLTAYDVK